MDKDKGRIGREREREREIYNILYCSYIILLCYIENYKLGCKVYCKV